MSLAILWQAWTLASSVRRTTNARSFGYSTGKPSSYSGFQKSGGARRKLLITPQSYGERREKF